MSSPSSGSSRSPHLEAAELLLPSLRIRLHAAFQDGPAASTANSVVFKAFSKVYMRNVAVKIINKKAIPPICEKFLPREVEITAKVNHPHLARCLIIITPSPSQIVIVQELYERGNLLELIMREKRLRELPVACRYFRQLAEALNYLHERKIVHRDVKLENIVLDSNEDIKLLDFGFARFIEKRERSRSFCGTRPYSCPQLNRLQVYDSYSADFYSAGVVLYTMVVGRWPIYHDDMTGRGSPKVLDYPDFNVPSTACRRLIAALLEEDECLRAGYQECIYSEWMSNEPNWVFAGRNFVYESVPPSQLVELPLKMEVE